MREIQPKKKATIAKKMMVTLTHLGSVPRNARYEAAKEYGLPIRQARKASRGQPFTFNS